MATLHKFKLLATQCTAATSPTRSPATAIHLRRRKTLRMLIRRMHTSGGHRLKDLFVSSTPPALGDKEMLVGHKLKDLFVSSSPPAALGERVSRESSVPTGGGGRPLSVTLRQRLLRRAWRPVLVGIPE